MNAFRPDLSDVYLKPGEIYIADRPALVRTVLGSCIAVTMYVPRLGIGSMCHALLPSSTGGIKPDGKCFWFADCCIRWMLKRFMERGAKRSEVEVKMFGGADVLTPIFSRRGFPTVGKQNIEAAMEVLKEEGLMLLAHDLGGTQGRKLNFYAHTGEVVLKRLAKENMVFRSEAHDMRCLDEKSHE